MEDFPETEHRNRERAIWPDEIPPEEMPYSMREEVPESQFASDADTPAAETEIAPEPLPVMETEPEPEHEEVWLAGPPPEDFQDFATPVIVRKGQADQPFEPEFVPVAYVPDTPAETARKSGLAYSAGIVFVVSVAFTLLLGWFADLLLGSSPWGLVGGVVLGSIIGFIQFFRIASRIYPSEAAVQPTLISAEKPEEQPPPF